MGRLCVGEWRMCVFLLVDLMVGNRHGLIVPSTSSDQVS